jgi:hypothetical protein
MIAWPWLYVSWVGGVGGVGGVVPQWVGVEKCLRTTLIKSSTQLTHTCMTRCGPAMNAGLHIIDCHERHGCCVLEWVQG